MALLVKLNPSSTHFKRKNVVAKASNISTVYICTHPQNQEIVHKQKIDKGNEIKVYNELYSISFMDKAPALYDNSEWNYSDFIKAIRKDMIGSVRIFGDKNQIIAMTKDGLEGTIKIPFDFAYNIVDEMITHDVKVRYQTLGVEKKSSIIYFAYRYLFPSILIFVFFRLLLSLLGNSRFSFGKSQAKFEEIPDTGVTFANIAGCDNAKKELQEIVEFLKNPEKFTRLGAKIPKGALLYGPSGTGKTLLSKAVAGEAKVPFFSTTASSWIEMFVGVGSSRVRSLFKDAASKAPCIIFIDEIDAVGKQRSSSSSPGTDERDQTINQLLSEMDGFDGNKGIIVIAATNRIDILDSALTRPGRFDRKIAVELPDFQGRVAILKVHTRNKPLAYDVDLETIAKSTAGSSGADLESLANEAAILACRQNADAIAMKYFDEALEKISIGLERDSKVMSERQKKIVAYHESGHTLAALYVGEYDIIRKVTIIPRGGAGGVTIFEPDQERVDYALYSRDYLENQLCVALGGRIAEELIFGKNQVTTGASSDLQRVYDIARRMVTDFGFSEKLGQVAWRASTFGNNEGYSQATAAEIDKEVRKIVDKAYKQTRDILEAHMSELHTLAENLIQKESMSGQEVKDLLGM